MVRAVTGDIVARVRRAVLDATAVPDHDENVIAVSQVWRMFTLDRVAHVDHADSGASYS